ncbi:MAG: response regulator [Cyanobacteria bacterium P01_F01_bin.53]
MTATQDWDDISLMALFRLEVETQVNELNQHLLILEQSGEANGASLDVLMRAAHSIKGAARIVQVEAAVKVSHALEDCFLAAQGGALTLTSDYVDVLLLGVDLLSRLSLLDDETLAEELPGHEADADTIVKSLEALLHRSGVSQTVSSSESDGFEVNDPEVNGFKVNDSESNDSESNDSNLATDPPLTLAKAVLTDAAISEVALAESVIAQTAIDKLPETKTPSEEVTPKTTTSSKTTTSEANNSEATAKTRSKSTSPLTNGTPSAKSAGRMIRISADTLNRLMGLAGESLVESNWLHPFAQSLLQLKRQQQGVLSLLEKAHQENMFPSEDSGLQPAVDHECPMEESIQALQACHGLLSDQLADLEVFSRRFGQLSDRLHREVIASHMCAFDEGLRGYGRLARNLAKKQGKQVVLEVIGRTTQVDRDILGRLDAPITHLLTNAIAHGIESPEARIAKGKPAAGTIRIEALHRSGMLVIAVEDDGAGIDLAMLGKKVVKRQLTTAEVADHLTDAELLEFLFLPGFSTVDQVDELAGRGYGLDLARNMAQSVGGALQVTTSQGTTCEIPSETVLEKTVVSRASSGTRFQFQLPLTLSVVRSLLFEISNEPYAMSLARISRVLRLPLDQVHNSENRPYFTLESEVAQADSRADGQTIDQTNDRVNGQTNSKTNSQTPIENISLVSASQLLALPSIPSDRDDLLVVVLGEPGNRYGICVDKLLEERDLVVRPLDVRLGKVPNITAAALTEKGDPILILDVADVVRTAERLMSGEPLRISSRGGPKRRFEDVAAVAAEGGGLTPETTGISQLSRRVAIVEKRVLVVDDSMTVRAMEKKLLQNHGYEVDIAVNGAEGWNAVRMNAYDLVITDVDMPRMTGIELIEHMRAYEPTQKLPVIVVSYKDREADQLAGLNAGANYYLTKSSFHDDGLINAVVDLIGETHVASQGKSLPTNAASSNTASNAVVTNPIATNLAVNPPLNSGLNNGAAERKT